ncbi:hypothetical protein CC86DRAFT_443940 [Ophiobolus disseminans]|uniref:Uncharacterized protein n=1 Tax=Ophiobolus disseminans TaxID=1469910 RepID=A0A6A7AAG6_9PLEO|nr:hypothetical protein CC86DRAFT_443940 [Ophiobolus disseminans]
MFNVSLEPSGRVLPLFLCHILCLCATWVQLAQAHPQSGTGEYATAALLGLIPSAPRSAIIPSAPIPSQANPTGSAPASLLTSGLIPSQAPSPNPPLVSLSTPAPIPSAPVLPGPPLISPIPSLSLTPGLGPIPSAPIVTDAPSLINSSRVTTIGTPQMTSTDQGLKPIPPAETRVGDPNGHHEITEPNFSVTKPCRACSPIIEITATGWLDSPAEEQHETSTALIRTRISAGPSNILISQAPSGGNFVIGGSITVTPGQTVTVDNVPVAIQTTGNSVEVVVGTTIIPLQPKPMKSNKGPRTTYMPSSLPPVLTFGSETIVANQQSQYVISGQTLLPGGPAITVSGTTMSLAPSATVIVVNGASSTIVPRFGNIWTTAAPALTFNNRVYTANRAGYITISPGTVLKPGGEAITVDGTTLSLDHSGTAVVVQGSTSVLQPVTTVVTLTRSAGAGGQGGGHAGYTSGGTWALPTGKSVDVPAKPVSGGGALNPGYTGTDGCLGSALLLIWWGLGFLAVGL